MQRSILTAFIVVIFSINSSAQTYGIRTGFDFVRLNLEKSVSSEISNDVGIHIGLIKEFKFALGFGIRTELNYVSIYKNEQLQIPVMANVRLCKRLQLLGGPNFGFILESEEKTRPLNFGTDLGLLFYMTDNIFIEGRTVYRISKLGNEINDYNDSGILSGLTISTGFRF